MQIIMFSNGASLGHEGLEDEINEWLNENKDRIDVVNMRVDRSPTSSAFNFLLVTIWYTVRRSS